MSYNDRISARVVILEEYQNEKTNNILNLKEYYGDWYSFDGKELDVSVYSESYTNKEKTEKEITYFYRLPNKSIKLIPKKHCKVVYEFL